MPPVVVSVINMKGGVGKSTIANRLGSYALARGLNVLVVDMDPQANLSQSFMREGYRLFLENRRPSVVELFQGYLSPSEDAGNTPQQLNPRDVIRTFTIRGVANKNLQLIPSRFDFSDNLTESVRFNRKALARFLAYNSSDRDLVLIDCAPTESVLTMAAYAASRYVLVPVKPEFFATIGFPLLGESIDAYKRNNPGQNLDVLGVVINNSTHDGGNDGGPEKQRSLHEIHEEAGKNDWHVFENEIPFSRGFPKMMRGDFTYRGNADDFVFFAKEFFDILEL